MGLFLRDDLSNHYNLPHHAVGAEYGGSLTWVKLHARLLSPVHPQRHLWLVIWSILVLVLILILYMHDRELDWPWIGSQIQWVSIQRPS